MPEQLKINYEIASLEEIQIAMNCAPQKEGFVRYQCIQFLYRGDDVKEAANRVNVSETTVRKYLHKFNNEGPSGLAIKGKSGSPRKILVDKFQAKYVPLVLDPKLVGEDNFTAIKFHFYLKERFKEKLCYQTVLNNFHENKLSLVVPRPIVIDKQDEEKRANFIEEIKELSNKEEEIWFCIENLWRYIKLSYFTGWYAKDVEQLIDKICFAFNSLIKETISSITNYSYLLK